MIKISNIYFKYFKTLGKIRKFEKRFQDFSLPLLPLPLVSSKFSTCLVSEARIMLRLKVEMLSLNNIYL